MSSIASEFARGLHALAGRQLPINVAREVLAKHGFPSASASIDGRRGFAALMAYRFDAALITEGLGTHWRSLG
jgi:hypothetical protein